MSDVDTHMEPAIQALAYRLADLGLGLTQDEQALLVWVFGVAADVARGLDNAGVDRPLAPGGSGSSLREQFEISFTHGRAGAEIEQGIIITQPEHEVGPPD